MGDRQFCVLFSYRDRPIQQGHIESTFLGRLLFDPRENLFEDSRHPDKNGWFHFAQIRANHFQRFPKINCHAVVQIHVHCHSLQHMRERQNRQGAVVFGEGKMS